MQLSYSSPKYNLHLKCKKNVKNLTRILICILFRGILFHNFNVTVLFFSGRIYYALSLNKILNFNIYIYIIY